MAEKTIELICECGDKFEKVYREYKRQLNRGRTVFYCSLSCSGRFGNGLKKLVEHSRTEKNSEHLRNLNRVFNVCDEFSVYRHHLRRVRTRAKSKGNETNLSLEYLKELFENQDGKCVYTGIDLIHPTEMEEKDHIRMASLDRIDSSKGYIKGNVQFISACMNFAKRDMPHKKAVEFVELIKESV